MSELLRFEDKPVGVFDKCRSLCRILLFVIFWIGVGFSIEYTVNKSDELYFQETKYVPTTEATYNISSVLGPLHLISFYDTKTLVKKINDLQEDEGFSEVDKHSGSLAASWDSFSDGDKTWLE